MDAILIDGTRGEGGGQILRTSLALSMITGRPVVLERIRGRRKKPGLMRQHLTGVLAAAEVCGAEVVGATLRSDRLRFVPGPIRSGTWRFSVGTAGSTALVLQTLLPALLCADGPSEVIIEGGTHAMAAPTFHFLQRSFAPALARFGGRLELELLRWGFYPAGGGAIRARVEPEQWRPARLVERGGLERIHAVAVVSNLPVRIAWDEVRTMEAALEGVTNEIVEAASPGPGNVVWVEIEAVSGTTIVTGHGRRGVPARRVAKEVAREAARVLRADVPVGEHLADQLLIPMALARGGELLSLPASLHTTTNLEVIQAFLPVRFTTREHGRRVRIVCEG